MCLDNLIKMRKVGKFINDIFRTVCNEFRLAMKDKGVLIFLFLVPLLYPVVYALIYNPELDRDVPVVVVDQSRSSKSRDLCRRIDASEAAMVAGYAADMEEAKHNAQEALDGYLRSLCSHREKIQPPQARDGEDIITFMPSDSVVQKWLTSRLT